MMKTSASHPPRRICVILPTYNNATTLGSVLQQVLRFVPHVIVVNDGSTDETVEVLVQFAPEQVTTVTRDENLGKGAALRDGFARAAAMGFTHAITMDADGQHRASDIPQFLAAIQAHPEALIVGVRDVSGGGPHPWRASRRKSRLLRGNSNFWVWVHTGRWVHDTQCGFRAYPLASIRSLRLKTRRYDFEVEVLVKALWAEVPVAEVPVQVEYGTASPSHFRPIRDFALVTHLNGCLLSQRMFLPASLRRVMHLESYRRGRFLRRALNMVRGAILQESTTPPVFAACVGLGVFFGILPIWGFQMATAMVVAHRLRLSKPVVLAASNISFPAAIPFILYVSLLTGQLVMRGKLDIALSLHDISLPTIWKYGVEYIVGGSVLAVVAGGAAVALSFIMARSVLALRSPAGHRRPSGRKVR